MTIRVLLVEDSPIALQMLKNMVLSHRDFNVVGTATDGNEALLKIPEVDPDVICTDLYMKGMDGLELTRQIMARFPKPVLVISVAVGEGQEQNAFELLQAGAIDVFSKPSTGLAADYAKEELLQKIRVLSGVKVFTRPLRPAPSPAGISHTLAKLESPPPSTQPIKIIGIGASTGGPQAVFKILRQLPANFPIPILCTQHISEGFLEGLVCWMNQECLLRVKVAEPGEEPLPGIAYYAPEKMNLEVGRQGRLIHTDSLSTEKHCPAVNVMFRSLALTYGNKAMGILLTGMGDDGAQGMLALARSGAVTIAQDEASSVVFGMPQEAIMLGAARHVLPIKEISKFVVASIQG